MSLQSTIKLYIYMSKLKSYILRDFSKGTFLAKVSGFYTSTATARENFSRIPVVSIVNESGVCLSIVFNLGNKEDE